MLVLPVIDLQRGVVVRGVAGQREKYRPIESRLCCDASPRSVARGLVDTFGFEEMYVADLDAIASGEPAWEAYAQISGCGLRLWVDAGIRDVARAESLAGFQAGGMSLAAIIAGLESLPHLGLLADLLAIVGPERLVFSLDLKDGRPLASVPELAALDAETIAEQAYEIGVRRMIVLDLARVGVGQGVGTEPLCCALRDQFPDLQLTSGGGVRGLADLKSLATAGCHAALVASALHDGRLTRDDVECQWHVGRPGVATPWSQGR